MPAVKYDIIIEQGATWVDSFTINIINEDGIKTPFNLTDYISRLQMRENYGEPILIELTTAGGGIVLGGMAGTVVATLTHVATAALTWTKAVYDWEIESPSGVVTRLRRGDVNVIREITK